MPVKIEMVSIIWDGFSIHPSETRSPDQNKRDVERIRAIEKDRIIQWLKEGKDDFFMIKTLNHEYAKAVSEESVEGWQERHSIAKTMVNVVFITNDEYNGKPFAGYNERGYYHGGIPE